MIDLTAALRGVVGALDQAGIDYVVVGSVAAAAWGVARTTRDVDTAALLTPAALESLQASLSVGDFYIPLEAARTAVSDGGAFNVLHTATGGKIDLFVVSPDDAFERSRLDRRVRAIVMGVATWVATPEDVLLAKLSWRLESRSEVQWRDCVELAGVNKLDENYLRHWGVELGVAEDLDELLAAVDRIRREGQ